jgi:Ni,Fe-hydrogenase I large subunit
MSHVLHFYHLVALDFVNPGLTRPFLAPRYDDAYYITGKRVYAVARLLPAKPQAFVLSLAVNNPITDATDPAQLGWDEIATALNGYLVGQYLKALDIRRIAHEAGAIFSGKMPNASCYTPGGITGDVTLAKVNTMKELVLRISKFIGSPYDFYEGVPGTMMFDTVAAAYLFPEYFWIGNTYEQFLAYGWAEEGFTPGIRALVARPGVGGLGDQRLLRRGRKNTAAAPVGADNVLVMDQANIYESVAHSRYSKLGNNYSDGTAWKHPWSGLTEPVPTNEYSWLKAPRYLSGQDYLAYEVGPLARMVVNQHTIVGAGPLGTALQAYFCLDNSLTGCSILQGNPIVSLSGYYGGCLKDAGYALAPAYHDPGLDLRTGVDAPRTPIQQLIDGLHRAYAALGGAVTGGPNLSGVLYRGDSVLDRIAARTLEARYMCDGVLDWLSTIPTGDTTKRITIGASGCTEHKIPYNPAHPTKVFKGYGLSEASRGALGHWIKIKKRKIIGYQCVVPTTWNANPRDANGYPGPAERSLQGKVLDGGDHPAESVWVANPSQPIELTRTTHSYDFCIACAVHLITPEGEVIKVDMPCTP